MNRSFETMFETGVDEMSWDDTVRFAGGRGGRERRESNSRYTGCMHMCIGELQNGWELPVAFTG